MVFVPSSSTLAQSMTLPPLASSQQNRKLTAQQRAYPISSALEEGKDKAKNLSVAAQKELAKAQAKVTQKTGGIELYSGKYFLACAFGGVIACGATHTAVTPLDLVKCRRQVNSSLYKSNVEAWKLIGRTEGFRGIFTGWSPTFFGYAAQGAFKYGGYEYFKWLYSDMIGPENASKYKTSMYLAASASAEAIADVALCPLEAIKVRMQTTIPPEIKGTLNGLSTITAKEGFGGLYKGLVPLWGRQIPYTMMKFASFEKTVEAIYGYLPKEKKEYGKLAQTGVSFLGGYIAGILCAIVSHPADVMVSRLNADRKAGESFGGALSRIYKEIGFRGCWNGLPVRIVMIGTLTGMQWLIYDSFKIYMGFPTTGGEEKPAGEVENKANQ